MASIIIEDYQYTSINNTQARVSVIDNTKSSYGDISSSVIIDGTSYTVTDMSYCFYECQNLVSAPTIPDTVTLLDHCFCRCSNLTTITNLPSNLTNMVSCFESCSKLTIIPTIPNTVIEMHDCFWGCTSLQDAPALPTNVVDISYCFCNCTNLANAPIIPTTVTNMEGCFSNCQKLTIAPVIPVNVTLMAYCFYNCLLLAGSFIVYNNPTYYTNIFGNTIENIYILDRNGVSSSNWQVIAEEDLTDNIFYFEDSDGHLHISGDYIYHYNDNRASIKALDLTKTSYEAVPASITIEENNYYIVDMTDCFKNCVNLLKAPTINSHLITDMSRCFENCRALSGNIEIYNAPRYYTDIFKDTTNDIYIVSKSGDLSAGWKPITALYSNVRYEVEDHTPPRLNITVIRSDENGKAKSDGNYVSIYKSYEIFQNYLPEGWAPAAPVRTGDNTERILIDLNEESSILPPAGTNVTVPAIEIINDPENSHTITYVLNDGYKTSSTTQSITRVIALLDFLGNGSQGGYIDLPGLGMAIGTRAVRDGLDIHFPTTIGKELLPATQSVYQQTTDTEVQPGKTYYIQTATGEYEVVEDPVEADLPTYYEKIGESVDLDNFQLIVGKYNRRNNNAVFIVGNGTEGNPSNLMEIGETIMLGDINSSQWKVRISNDGVYMLDPNNLLVNQITGSGNIVGYENGARLMLNAERFIGIKGDGSTFMDVSSTSSDIETTNSLGGIYKVYNREDVVIKDTKEINLNEAFPNGWTHVEDGSSFNVVANASGTNHSPIGPSQPDFNDSITASFTKGTEGGAISSDRYIILYYDGADTLTILFNILKAEGWFQYFHSSFYDVRVTYPTAAPFYSFGIDIDTDNGKTLGFAIGRGTIPSAYGFAMGKYNEDDTNDDYAFLIGNGTSTNRSNALAVDWDGNIQCAGGIYATPTEISLTFSQCANGSYTRCYRIGNTVFFSWNINITTATASYDYIRGLPIPLGGGWGCSGNTTGGNQARFWITSDGTLRADGTVYAGWNNGNVSYICQ